jgi:hypothetical protein
VLANQGNVKTGHETVSKIIPTQGEDKTRALFPFDVSERPTSMSASGVLKGVIGFYAPAIAA